MNGRLDSKRQRPPVVPERVVLRPVGVQVVPLGVAVLRRERSLIDRLADRLVAEAGQPAGCGPRWCCRGPDARPDCETSPRRRRPSGLQAQRRSVPGSTQIEPSTTGSRPSAWEPSASSTPPSAESQSPSGSHTVQVAGVPPTEKWSWCGGVLNVSRPGKIVWQMCRGWTSTASSTSCSTTAMMRGWCGSALKLCTLNTSL